jgi:RNA chaperone Hfq
MKDDTEIKTVIRRKTYIPDNSAPANVYTADAPAGPSRVGRQPVTDRRATPTDSPSRVSPEIRKTTSGRSVFNLQDQFLNEARKNETIVVVRKMDGETVIGKIRSFDCFCVLFACVNEPDKDMLLYKHALESIAVLP